MQNVVRRCPGPSSITSTDTCDSSIRTVIPILAGPSAVRASREFCTRLSSTCFSASGAMAASTHVVAHHVDSRPSRHSRAPTRRTRDGDLARDERPADIATRRDRADGPCPASARPARASAAARRSRGRRTRVPRDRAATRRRMSSRQLRSDATGLRISCASCVTSRPVATRRSRCMRSACSAVRRALRSVSAAFASRSSASRAARALRMSVNVVAI